MEKKEHSSREVHTQLGLVASIRGSQGSEDVVSTSLQTSERVIARVTDGIYRQPGSALRELVSNAFDADATRVVIKTDAPRFERISVEDNGHGMTPEILAHLLFNIGGSAKRNENDGPSLGVTSSDDPTKSPNGRQLIGKIGIGLFSVSQLTHTFQIVTKVRGDNHRTVATVAMRQYADDEIQPDSQNEKVFESGKVNVWREKASDVDAHGTSIILTGIRRQARDTLRSREIWSAIEHLESLPEAEERQAIDPPRFHIGRVDSGGSLLTEINGEVASLPWEKGDPPDVAFSKLVDGVWDEAQSSTPNPKLDRIFDYYLQMVWQLSLAVPLPYVGGHLFDKKIPGWAQAFLLSNQPKGSASAVDFSDPSISTLRDALSLTDPVGIGEFEVYCDDLKLSRPIKFSELPTTNNAVKTPLVFVGQCREEFARVPRELSGGPLQFEAYLFWTPRVAPTEHQGVLVRIHGSSGTLFDPTFLRYQVSEQTRLRQITCEIFVSEGLDSALNIDRESFNGAHPHSVFLTKWLHSALRQLASAQKRVASEVRNTARHDNLEAAVSGIQKVASDIWREEADDPGAAPPTIALSTSGTKKKYTEEAYVYERDQIVPERSRANTAKGRAQTAVLEEKLKAIAQVLASFGLLDAVPKRKQEKLLKAIYEILEAPGE